MTHYNKGANAERELLDIFYEKGFGVVRVAGSARTRESPDVLALSPKRKFVFECKAVGGNYLNIERPKMEELIHWEKVSGIEFFIAWKLNRKGWVFLKPENFKVNEKNYSIKVNEAQTKGKTLEILLGEQMQLMER